MGENIKIDFDEIYFNKTLRKYAWDMPVHTHNWDEIYYLTRGEIQYFIDNSTYTVKEGSFVYIPKSVMHKTHSKKWDSFHEKYVVNFSDDIFPLGFKEEVLDEVFAFPVVNVPLRKRSRIERIFADMEYQNKADDKFGKSIFINLLYEMMVYLFRLKKENLLTYSKYEHEESFADKIVTYINSNFSNEITISNLAEIVKLSENCVSRKFKKMMGISVFGYLNSVRIQKAKEMLVLTDMTITEISTEIGYNNSNYFAKQFKRVESITPLKYRKQNKL